jgi:hypothetical protein
MHNFESGTPEVLFLTEKKSFSASLSQKTLTPEQWSQTKDTAA